MAETTVVIEKVFTQDGNTSGKSWTRYDVKAGGKKFSTFKDVLGEKAQSLQNETAKIVYTEKQSGEYTNYEISSIEAANGVLLPEGTNTYKADPRSITEEQRQLRIMRQSGLERAILTAVSLPDIFERPIESVDELYALSDAFIDYFVNGAPVPAEDGPRF